MSSLPSTTDDHTTPPPPFPAKRSKILSHHDLRRSIATIHVGPSQVPFHFHKEQLSALSPVLSKALNGSFAEAATSSMSLPEDEVDVVQAFEGIISPDSLLMESSGDDVWESGTPGWMLLPAKTYVFADKIDCEVVRAYILRSLDEVVLANPRREYIEKEVVELAFAGLPPGALRRQFLVDLSVLVCTPSRIGDVAGEFHNEFVAAVLYLMQVRYLALKAGKRILMHWGKYVPAKMNEAEELFRFGYGKCKDIEVVCEKNLEKYVGAKGVAV